MLVVSNPLFRGILRRDNGPRADGPGHAERYVMVITGGSNLCFRARGDDGHDQCDVSNRFYAIGRRVRLEVKMKAHRIGEMAAVFVIIFALLSSFIVTSFAVTPAISLTQGGKGNAIKSLSFVSNTPAGNAIIVVEWLGTVPNPCNYIATPNDTAGDTFNSFACVQDGNSGAIRGYYVNSSVGSVTNTINCRWAANNTHIGACYVFTVSNPGTITEPKTNIGLGTGISVASFTPSTSSLILAVAGIQTFCQAVGVTSASGMGSGYTAFSPASECYSTPYGLSGEWSQSNFIGPLAPTTAAMTLSNSGVWSEIVIQIASSGAGIVTACW